MPRHLRFLLLAACAGTLAGCGLIYQPVVQQGNLIDKQRIAELKVGMTKRQVLALLGTPAIHSPFDQDRWDYLMATYVRGKPAEEHKLTLVFQYGALARTEGEYYGQSASNEQKLLEEAKKYHIEEPGKGARGDKNHDGGSGS